MTGRQPHSTVYFYSIITDKMQLFRRDSRTLSSGVDVRLKPYKRATPQRYETVQRASSRPIAAGGSRRFAPPNKAPPEKHLSPRAASRLASNKARSRRHGHHGGGECSERTNTARLGPMALRGGGEDVQNRRAAPAELTSRPSSAASPGSCRSRTLGAS